MRCTQPAKKKKRRSKPPEKQRVELNHNGLKLIWLEPEWLSLSFSPSPFLSLSLHFLCLLSLSSFSVSLSLSLSVPVCLSLSLSVPVCPCLRVLLWRLLLCRVCVSLWSWSVRVVWCCTLKKKTVCTFKTSPCVPAPRPHVVTLAGVVPVHTGGVLNVHTERGVSSNHSLYLIKLFSFSNLEGSPGGNQQPDG